VDLWFSIAKVWVLLPSMALASRHAGVLRGYGRH
jgi:hypothetical protein